MWRLELVDVKMMLTLAGAGCIVVLFFLFIGKFNSVLTIISKLFSAMTPIIIGFVIAFLLNPLVNHLRRAIKNDLTKMFKKAKEKTISSISDAMAVTLSVLLFLLIITALLWILIPQLYESVQNLYNNFDKYVSNVETMVNKVIRNYPDLVSMVNNYMDDIEESIKKMLTDKLLPNMNNIVVAMQGLTEDIANMIIFYDTPDFSKEEECTEEWLIQHQYHPEPMTLQEWDAFYLEFTTLYAKKQYITNNLL